MIRPFIRTLAARVQAVRDRWYARPFAQWLGDSRLWSLQRRGITLAFGAGLAICFVPLPVHVPVALAVAAMARVNVPVILSTGVPRQPGDGGAGVLTSRTASAASRRAHGSAGFNFELSWDWLQNGLGPMWKAVPGRMRALRRWWSACSGWVLLELLWRRHVIKKYRARRGALKRLIRALRADIRRSASAPGPCARRAACRG